VKESIFSGKIKIGKELSRNIVGPVPEKFYNIGQIITEAKFKRNIKGELISL